MKENKTEALDAIFSFERADDSPGFVLWQVTMVWQRKINALLKKFDLTHTQFVLLASLCWLERNEKNLTQVQIARFGNMDVMMASNVIRMLESKGLLTRESSSTDTRAKSVAVTWKGIAIAREAVREVEMFDRDFFSPVGDKIADVNLLLRKLI